MTAALQGFKVLDLTHVMSGPFCTRQLVLLGAEVTKIEKPGDGDVMRYYGHDPQFGRNSPNFVGYNAGKKSVALDWTSKLGAEALRRLVAEADVLVENFRPGVLAARGFSWEACQELNPDLIYCSISGYGQESILRDNPAYDHIAQAMSGLMSLQGGPEDPPIKVGFPLVDTFTGYMAAFAIVSALLRRERTGEGQRLDVSMLDASMVLMSSMILKYNATGVVPPRVGNKGFSLSATADMFQTKDRPISIGANTDKQFEALCRLLKLEHLLQDPRYANASGRWEHADTLRPVVREAIAQWHAEELEVALNRVSVPAAVVRDLAGVVAHPHFNDRDTFQPITVPSWGRETKVVNGGFTANADSPTSNLPPPDLGEHTEEVLRSIGFEGEELEQLLVEGQVK